MATEQIDIPVTWLNLPKDANTKLVGNLCLQKLENPTLGRGTY